MLVAHETIERLCQVQTIIGFDSVVNEMATEPDGVAHEGLIGINQTINSKKYYRSPYKDTTSCQKDHWLCLTSLVE
jgi:hypothetical protein